MTRTGSREAENGIGQTGPEKCTGYRTPEDDIRAGAKGFAASGPDSIPETFAIREDGLVALPFGLYENGSAAGLLMIGYGSIGEEDMAVLPLCVRSGIRKQNGRRSKQMAAF